LLGPQHNLAQKKRKKYTNADTGISTNKVDPPPLRHPENPYHVPSTLKCRVLSNTFKKESNDDAAAARTSPRVFPGTPREVGKGYTRCPSGRKATPAGVTTSVPDEPTRISPDPKKTTTPDNS
jgi:hypothetical protein